ncbi:YybH family protein [Aquimarina algiphila]|uniref:YybH family protein n=1 Tax=Aquimarina algiphila TaxID=2047982 RepID=UPI002490C784|nr:hypothetical protein [Aquimarina algiphila]
MRKLFLIALIGYLVTSCANEEKVKHVVKPLAEQTAEQKKYEEDNLMETSRKWSKTFSTEEYFSFIGKDGIMMAPDKGIIRGHEKIRKILQEFQSLPGFKVAWEPQEAFVSKSVDLGYTIDLMLVNFDGENGNTVSLFEKVVTVWKKDKKGEWKMAVDIWNVDPTITSIYK